MTPRQLEAVIDAKPDMAGAKEAKKRNPTTKTIYDDLIKDEDNATAADATLSNVERKTEET